MTLPSTVRRAGPFYGNGSATQFPFYFKVYTRSDISFEVQPANAGPPVLVLDTDYSVTLNTNQESTPGGFVTYPLVGSPLPLGDRAAIAGNLAYSQPTDLPDGGAYRARNVETMGDRLAMLIQQIRELLSRTLMFPLTDGMTPVLPAIAQRKNRLLGFDDTGQFVGVLPTPGDASGLALDLASSGFAAKGAGMVGYNSARAYAALTVGGALNALMSAGFLSVSQFGTTGTADDTAVFQAAMTAAAASKRTLLIPSGTYTVLPLFVPSDIVLFFEPGAVVMAKAGYGVNDRMLNINGVSNVTIFGNGAKMKMPKAEYLSGEQRHGVFIINSTDVNIYNLISQDTGGDCFYIGRDVLAGTHSQRVNLTGCHGINGRRQGLSIVSGDTINIHNCSFRNTTGTPPAYGIDIEPNDSSDVIRSINITNVKTSGNFGGGIIIALQFLALTTANEVSINICGWLSDGDGANSPNNANSGLRVTGNGTGAWANPIRGIVKISNFEIRNPQSSGIWNTYWQANSTPYLQIEDGVIINPGSSSPANDEDKCGVVLWGYNIGGQDFGNIEINRVRVRDTRGTPATYSPVYIFKTAGATGVGQGRNIRLRDVMGEGFTPLTSRGHVLAIVDIDQSTITYSQEQVVNDMPDDSSRTRGYAGYTITCSTSRVNTLPKASLNRGLSYKFVSLVTNQTLQVRPTTGDIIDGTSANADKDMVLSVYSAQLALTATDQPANFYRADVLSHWANRPLLAGEVTRPPTIVYVTAMPTSGFWAIGDRAINTNIGAGSVSQWNRITTGTGNVLNTDWRAGATI